MTTLGIRISNGTKSCGRNSIFGVWRASWKQDISPSWMERMERVERVERMEREAAPWWHRSRRGEDEIFIATQNVLCSVRSVGWEEYWNLLGSCGSESISGGQRRGGIHTLRAASCSRLFCLIGNLHKYNILELRPNVCLSEAATFKRQGQVRRCFSEKCEKGADRLKINASHGRQVGGVNNKNRFSLPFSCSRSSFLSFDVSHTNIGWYQLVSQRLLDITRNSAITKKKKKPNQSTLVRLLDIFTHTNLRSLSLKRNTVNKWRELLQKKGQSCFFPGKQKKKNGAKKKKK